MAGVDSSGSGASQAMDGAGTATGLISMAEYFLSLEPRRVYEAVQCLMAALTLTPPPRIEARARLQLGMILYYHTYNLTEAKEHLDKAMLISQAVAHGDDVRFEAASISARILTEQGSNQQAKTILRSVLESSPRFPYWHCRLMFQLIDVMAKEKDVTGVCAMLTKCAEYAQQVDAPYTRLLSTLYKGAYLLTHRSYAEAAHELSACRGLLDAYKGRSALELEAFYLVIQVAHLLVAGQVKTSKPHLKKLQQCVKSLSSEQEPATPQGPLTAESFHWLSRKQIYVTVYLVSMMHWVQAGYTEKALSFADKAMKLIDELKDNDHIVLMLKAHILENTIVCFLMQGSPAKATDNLQQVIEVCHKHPQLVYSHRAVLHCLLGLYALALDNFEKSVQQFTTALQHTNDPDLRTFIILNLAISYMKMDPDKDQDLSDLMQSLQVDNPSTACQSLKAAVFYVRGLYSSCQLKLHDAKRHLRESLVMSNTGDLNKLTTCALILLGQIFLSLGNTKETQDMVSPAMLLANKIPDRMLQLWASRLLGELHHLTGNQQGEEAEKGNYATILKELQADQAEALKSPHSGLVQWTVGDWPVPKMSPKEQQQQQQQHFLQRTEASTSSVQNPKLVRDAAKCQASASGLMTIVPPSVSHIASWSEGSQVGKMRDVEALDEEPMELTYTRVASNGRSSLIQGDAVKSSSGPQGEVSGQPLPGGRPSSSVANERLTSDPTSGKLPSSRASEKSGFTVEKPLSKSGEKSHPSLINESPSKLNIPKPTSTAGGPYAAYHLESSLRNSAVANRIPSLSHPGQERGEKDGPPPMSRQGSVGSPLPVAGLAGHLEQASYGVQGSVMFSPAAQGSGTSGATMQGPLQPSDHVLLSQVSSPTLSSRVVTQGSQGSPLMQMMSSRPQAAQLSSHPQPLPSHPQPLPPHLQTSSRSHSQQHMNQQVRQATPAQTKDSSLAQMLRAQGTHPSAHTGSPLAAQSHGNIQGGDLIRQQTQHTEQHLAEAQAQSDYQQQFHQQQLQRFQQQVQQQKLLQQQQHLMRLQQLKSEQQAALASPAPQILSTPSQQQQLLTMSPQQQHLHITPRHSTPQSPSQQQLAQPVSFQQQSSPVPAPQSLTPQVPLQHHMTPPNPSPQKHLGSVTPSPQHHVTSPSPSLQQYRLMSPTPSQQQQQQMTPEQLQQHQLQQKTLQQFQQHQLFMQQRQLLQQEQEQGTQQTPAQLPMTPAQQNTMLQYQQQQGGMFHFSPQLGSMSSMSLVEKQRRQAILQHQYALQQQQQQQQLQQQQLSAMYQQQQQQQLLRQMGHPMMVSSRSQAAQLSSHPQSSSQPHSQQQFAQPSAFGSLSLGDGVEDKGLPQLGHHGSFQRVNQEYPSFQAGIHGPSVLSYGAAGSGAPTYFASNGLGQGIVGSPLMNTQPAQESKPSSTMSR